MTFTELLLHCTASSHEICAVYCHSVQYASSYYEWIHNNSNLFYADR